MDMNHNIFVSSTFQDMHAERDLLHHHVIPELLFKYSKYHLHIETVDLRWGIDTTVGESEEENTHKIMRVCFDEIDRSQPFFFAFIGQRYGWIPPLADVESALLGYNANFRGKDRLGVTEMEILYALTQKPDGDNCFFFIRDGLKPEDITDENIRNIYFPTDPSATEKCEQLKAFLYTHYRENTFEYLCRWDDVTQKIVGLESLGKLIVEKVSQVIEQQLESHTITAEEDKFRKEEQLQQFVRNTQSKHLFGREEELQALTKAYCTAPSGEVAIIAPSGIGKSTLLAGLCQQAARDGWKVLPFWAGISEQSRNFHFMARYLCAQLEPSLKHELITWPYAKVKEQLYLSLKEKAAHQKTLIIIDSVNQFLDPQALDTADWLDTLLIPDGVRVVYSCLPEHEALFSKREATLFRLGGIHPHNIVAAARGLASSLHKEFPKSAEPLLLQKTDNNGMPSCCVPFYLTTLIELLCSFDYEDYQHITAKQTAGTLRPIEAINQYIYETLENVGGSIEAVLLELIQKSKTQLGDNFYRISTLLTNADFGIGEDEMLAIINRNGPLVASADFSVYRHMFRIHIQQRSGGRWSFNHDIVRSAVKSYIADTSITSLWENAAAYYQEQSASAPNKAREAVLYMAKLGRYREIATFCNAENAAFCAEIIYNILKQDSDIFWACCPDERKAFFCEMLVQHCGALMASEPLAGLRCLSVALKQLLNYGANEEMHRTLIAELYVACGELLLQADDSQAKSFLEIAMHILLRTPSVTTDSRYQMATRISQALDMAQDFFSAESYAKQACNLAQQASDQIKAQANYRLARCIEQNNFSLRKLKAPELFWKAMCLAEVVQDWELAASSALGYLRCGVLSTHMAQREKTIQFLEQLPQNAVSNALAVEIQLYLAQNRQETSSDPATAYAALVPIACRALAQDNSAAMLSTYKSVWEHYSYALMLHQKNCVQEVRESVAKADAACHKLEIHTNLVSWQDNRIALGNDLQAYLSCHDIPEKAQTALPDPQPQKRLRDSQAYAVRIIVMYSCLLTLALVTAVEIGIRPFDSRLLFTLFADLCETIVNIFAVVVLFYGGMMLRTQDKNTQRYRDYRRDCLVYILLFGGTLLLNIFIRSISISRIYLPFEYDKYHETITFSLLLSITYCMALTWLLPSLLSHTIDRSTHIQPKQYARHLYRKNEILTTHTGLILLASCGLVLSLIGLGFPYLHRNEVILSLWYTTPSEFLTFCWVPVAVQLILSWTELRRYPKGHKTTTTGKRFRVSGLLFPALVLAGLALSVSISSNVSKQIGRQLQFQAHQYFVKDGVYYKVDDQGAYAYRYWQDDDAVYDLVIPTKIGSYPVYWINGETFYDANVRSIRVPDTITGIGPMAFASCQRLEVVQLPQNITRIGERAFYYCTSLRDVNIPDALNRVDSQAFYGCTSLTTLSAKPGQIINVKPSALEATGIDLREKCGGQGFYTLGASIAYVNPDHAGVVRIPDGIRAIPDDAFRDCQGITQVYLPDSVVSIGEKAFSDCESLYYVRLPASLKSIGSSAFSQCDKLLFIDNFSVLPIEKGSTEYGEIGRCAWEISKEGTALPQQTSDGLLFSRDPQNGKQTLVAAADDRWQLILPEKFQNEEYVVRKDLFASPPHYISLVLPERNLNSGWRHNISFGEIVYFGDSGKIHIDEQGLILQEKGNEILIYGYAGDDPCVDLTISATKPVTIMKAAFQNNASIHSITITGSAILQDFAFYQCPQLEKVVLSGDISLGSNAFADCYALQEVLLDAALDEVPYSCFENCIRLSQLTLPETVTTINSDAFADCTALTEISLPAIVHIEDGAFSSCTELKTIHLGAGLTQVDSYAFYQCRSLERVDFGGSVEQWIGILFEDNYASPFWSDGYCKLYIDGLPLEHLAFDEPITDIGAYSFCNYRALLSVDLVNSVKQIGESAFYKCENLQDIYGYDALEIISAQAFALCDSLRSLPLGDHLTKIGSEAFMDCSGITSVYIPANVKTMGKHIFQSCFNLERIEFPQTWENRKNRIFGEDISPQYIVYKED